MDKKVSYIKERVLEIADFKGVGKEKFCESIGMTYGNFKGSQKKTALNSDTIDRILSNHPDVNAEWLITGKGKMIKALIDEESVSESDRSQYSKKEPDTNYQSMIDTLQRLVDAQDKTIKALEEVIATKSKRTATAVTSATSVPR